MEEVHRLLDMKDSRWGRLSVHWLSMVRDWLSMMVLVEMLLMFLEIHYKADSMVARSFFYEQVKRFPLSPDGVKISMFVQVSKIWSVKGITK